MTRRSHGSRMPRAARRSLAAAVALGVPAMMSAGGPPAQAAFPGDNGRIACSGGLYTPETLEPGQSRLEIFTMNGDGSGQIRLTDNTASDYYPKFSPDGQRIAFVRDPANSGDEQIWTMNADGTNQTGPLTEEGRNRPGSWSPDGSRIVFSTNRDINPANGRGQFEIYVMNQDGSDETRITDDVASDSQPVWSPDGAQIAFTSSRGGNSDIWVMNADGSNPVNLTADSPATESQAAWSADGTQIAFQSNRPGFPRPTGEAPNFEIYRMSADGTGVTQLTFSDYSGGGSFGSGSFDVTGYDVFPAWAPEGNKIVFHSGRAQEYRDTGQAGVVGQWEVYTIDARAGEGGDGAGIQRLTSRPYNDEGCDWQPVPRQLLTVVKAGDGSGTVVSAPAGIQCGADCSQEYSKGTEVTLVGTPASGSTFSGFSGEGCSGSSCTVTMGQARTVTATFAAVPQATPTPEPTVEPIERQAAGIRVRIQPRRDLEAPFQFRVRGRLIAPEGIRDADACQGRMSIRFKTGKRTISSRKTQVDESCRYNQRVKFKRARRFKNRRKLRVIVRFEGNQFLLPRKADVKKVRVR